MTATFTDDAFPAVPYPGARPACSFVHDERTGTPLTPHGTGWLAGRTSLEKWLAQRDAPPLAGRIPVLSYGSNACPTKITWLRAELGLRGPVVVLRATCTGLAAVWAAGLRVVDDQRPATLAAVPGAREVHALWLATPDQVDVLDVCEGVGVRYRRLTLHGYTVELDGGAPLSAPQAYAGAADIRMPLLVEGAPVRCADVDQVTAAALTGLPARSDGLPA